MAQQADTADAPTFLRELPLALRAYSMARAAHLGQRRESDAARYIVHPLEVASLLHNSGHREPVVAAAILHDSVEDSELTVDEIAQAFGTEISGIVAAMTEDASIEDFHQRKRVLREQIARCGPEATALYAADKISKVRELRSRATRGEDVLDPSNEAAQDKLEHYVQSLLMLEQIMRDHPLVRQLRFELEILIGLPPRPDLLGV